MNSVMTLRNVSAFYDGKPAIEHISADIPKNEITAIIGPSGCGKSTLLRCMNGLLMQEPGAAVHGEIALDGTDIFRLPSEELRRRVGLVFQTPTPFPFSILKNLTFAPQYYGQRDKKALETLAIEKLQLCGLYDEVKDDLRKNAQKLSGGQQQRLCIARALTVEPDILLLEIPGRAPMDIANVVFDYNGTIAVDGAVLPELRGRLEALLKLVPVYVLTADTYGTVRAQCEPLGLTVHTFPREGAAKCKEDIVKSLSGASACFGNGFNDIEMFDAAALSIAILEGEGLCAALLPHADILVRSAAEGLDLLLKECRLKATLRS